MEESFAREQSRIRWARWGVKLESKDRYAGKVVFKGWIMDKRFLDVRDHILLVSRLREWRLSTARTVGACALKQVEFVGRPYFIVEIKLLNMTAQTAP
jgi:hypothetical protein